MSVQPPPNAPPTPVWPLYRAMVGIGLVCGLVIVVVFLLTRPVIADKRAAALEAAVFQAVPGSSIHETFVAQDDGSFAPLAAGEETAASGDRVHAAYDADGKLLGLAVEAAGPGYQDTIRLLYGFSPQEHALVGLAVLDSKETPGLGDRITSDPDFQRNFEHLDVTLDRAASDPGAAIAHPIETVASGSKTEPWQIDGITGATISSKAVGAILRQSTALWVPRLERRVEDFQHPKAETEDAVRDANKSATQQTNEASDHGTP